LPTKSQSSPRTARNASAGGIVRRATEATVFVLVGLVFWRTWFLEGMPIPFSVASGSMAKTLLGPHRAVVCGDCGFRFVCGCDRPSTDPRAVCPNCGYAGNDVRDWPELPADRVLIDRATFQLRQPRRWEVVAFRTPGRERDVATKRVVGLPGESVEIRDGDVYIDGEIVRKNLPQQQATSILVYDARHPPHRFPQVPARWQPEANRSRWSQAGGRFVHPGSRDPDAIDWLTYGHWRRVPGRPDQVQPGPVLTETSYNQGRRDPAGTVVPTADLRLSFRCARTSGRGALWVRANDGREEFAVRIDPADRRIQVLRNGAPVPAAGAATIDAWREPLQVDVSLVDQQFLVGRDGRTVIALEYCRGTQEPSARPFAVGCQGLEVELEAVCVFRDVHYAMPEGKYTTRRLGNRDIEGDDEYYVLGDNSPVSEDSRRWPAGRPLTSESLVGKPFAAFPPGWRGPRGPWYFRIPDLTAIRYIR